MKILQNKKQIKQKLIKKFIKIKSQLKKICINKNLTKQTNQKFDYIKMILNCFNENTCELKIFYNKKLF